MTTPPVRTSAAAVAAATDDDTDAPRTRRDLLRAGGAAAVISLLGIFGRTSPAAAQRSDRRNRRRDRRDRRQPDSGASGPPGTTIETSSSPALDVSNTSKNGDAVGVHGSSLSPEGTAGLFVAEGGGTALEARSSGRGGTALRTRGRVELIERSGVATASGGAEFVIPVAGGLSEDSIVLATLQDHHVGVHVESASVLDREEGLIVVRLNQALAEPGRVGWIVLG